MFQISRFTSLAVAFLILLATPICYAAAVISLSTPASALKWQSSPPATIA